MSRIIDTAKYIPSTDNKTVDNFPVIQRHNAIMILKKQVNIVKSLQQSDIIGTSFLIRNNNSVLAITAAHVIENHKQFFLGFPNRDDPTKICPILLNKSEWYIPSCNESLPNSNFCLKHDFAIFNITTQILKYRESIELGYFSQDEFALNDVNLSDVNVMIYGFPHGKTFILKNGTKTAYSERIPGQIQENNSDFIKTYKSAVSNGVSGGPVVGLVNGKPKVIGILKSSGYKYLTENGRPTRIIVDKESGSAVKFVNLYAEIAKFDG